MTGSEKPWLVIGAKGMLGTDLTKALGDSGVDTVGVDLPEVDIRRPDSLLEAFRRHEPGVVFNTAALTDVDGCESRANEAFDVNATGAGNVARACSEMDALLVHISTDYVFDGLKGSPYQEEDPPRPLGVYGRSKEEGERLVRELLPDKHCIVRTQWLFGPHGRNFVEAILGQVGKKDTLRVVSDQFGSPTYTADLSAALIELCMKHGRGTFQITNRGVTSWHGFASAILTAAGITGVRVDSMTSEELGRPAPRPAYSVLGNSKFVQRTGLDLRPWEDALAAYLTRTRNRTA